ncbi:replication protein P [Pseudomonas sp. A-1]|uniref:replication protein P n=1 Tax=Pseudomonas sp. A-1 TaxID=1821274 RepID=UPI0014556AD3|nr:replication protein P [Pseudomonas sp. A-1]
MKPVDELLRGARAVLSTSCTTTTGDSVESNVHDLEARARTAVKRVFATLKSSYPAWYERHYGDVRAESLAKRIWMTGIKSLTDVQVDRGLQRMVLDADYPPSLKEFVKLCLRIDGVPDAGTAWYQALRKHYGHEAVRVAAKLTGTYDLQRSGYGDVVLRAEFERNYAIVVRRLENGEPLDGAILKGICHDSQKSVLELADEHAEQQFQERLKQQGVPQAGQAARLALLAKLGIQRGEQAHG